MAISQFSTVLGAGSQSQSKRQASCQAVHDGLIAAGLVQTGDTGQLDFSTIPAPNTAAADFGWRVYELIDQFTPVTRFLLKIYFRGRQVGSVAGNSEVVFDVMAGFETDGEGNFVGPSIVVNAPRSGSTSLANKPTATVQNFICVKEGFVGIALGVGAFFSGSAPSLSGVYGNACFAVVNRTKNKEGVYDSRGITALSSGTGGFFAAISPASYTDLMLFTSNTALVSGLVLQDKTDLCYYPGNIPEIFSSGGDLFLHHLSVATPWIYPVHELAIYPSYSTYAVGDKFIVNVAGVDRTFIALGSVNLVPGSAGTPRVGGGYQANGLIYPYVGVAMLWE